MRVRGYVDYCSLLFYFVRNKVRRYFRTMWGRMCTTGVGPAGSVDRAEDTVGVVLCLLFEIVS